MQLGRFQRQCRGLVGRGTRQAIPVGGDPCLQTGQGGSGRLVLLLGRDLVEPGLLEINNSLSGGGCRLGEDDLRVPMAQSVEMYRALKSLGVPTHLYVAPREGHVWKELRHELFKMNVELDWFETHATGRLYQWEIPPGDELALAVGQPSTPQ